MKSTALVATVLLAAIFLLAQCQSPAKPPGLTEAEKSEYLEKGKAIAAETFAALSGRLSAALEEGGVEHAVPFCNLVALPLTDSLSQANNATIRRTSLKLRNPKNAPSDWEKRMLSDFEAKEENGEEIKPLVQMLDDGSVAFAAPVRVMPLCLQCHGKVGETLTIENAALVKRLYPSDEAVGYAEGGLRGMWSIRFKK